MVTKQTEPDLGSGNDQEQRQRKRAQRRKAAPFVVVAALVVAVGAAFALANRDTTTDVADQPTQSPTTTGAVTTTTFTSVHLGYIDLTTGETSMTQIIPHNSAIDVSPDGDRIAYVAGGVVNIADLDGSNVQVLKGTFTELPRPLLALSAPLHQERARRLHMDACHDLPPPGEQFT